MSKKSYIYLLFIATFLFSSTSTPLQQNLIQIDQQDYPLDEAKSNGTEAYFLSPHSLNRQREVHDALQKFTPKLTIQTTTYSPTPTAKYTITDVSLQVDYNDGKQTIQITGDDNVTVSGGRFSFTYRFNWSKTQSGSTVNGTAEGAVTSDSYRYSKKLFLSLDSGKLVWSLIDINPTSNLTITSNFTIKKFNPYNEADHQAIQDMLDGNMTTINPGTFKTQIINKFNTGFQYYLKSTLNSEIIGEEINYSFTHTEKGQLNMTIQHSLYGFNVNKTDGYKIIFLSKIKGESDPICDGETIPIQHYPFEYYGGTQNLHLLCLYQSVLEYMQKKTWLDVALNNRWDVNAFQFYAGDLFDLINNLPTNFTAKQLINGTCKARAQNLSLKSGRTIEVNTILVNIVYDCMGAINKKVDSAFKSINVLDFTVNVQHLIVPKAGTSSLSFTIKSSQVSNPTFRGVNSFYVSNVNLATFKLNQVLTQLQGTQVFGSGFPTMPHSAPSTQIQPLGQYIIYYDKTHADLAAKEI